MANDTLKLFVWQTRSLVLGRLLRGNLFQQQIDNNVNMNPLRTITPADYRISSFAVVILLDRGSDLFVFQLPLIAIRRGTSSTFIFMIMSRVRSDSALTLRFIFYLLVRGMLQKPISPLYRLIQQPQPPSPHTPGTEVVSYSSYQYVKFSESDFSFFVIQSSFFHLEKICISLYV